MKSLMSIENAFCGLVLEMKKFQNQTFKTIEDQDGALSVLLALPGKLLEETDKHGVTSEEFWECSCEKNFLHKVSESACQVCGDVIDESPDALMSSVVQNYIQENIDKEN